MNESRGYSYACEAGTPRALRDALLGRVRRIGWAAVGLGVLTLGLALLASEGLWVAIVSLLGCGMTLLWQSRAGRFAHIVGAGQQYASTFEDDSVVFIGPLASTRIPYTSFDMVEVRGGATAYRLKGTRGTCGLPVAIFPPAEVELVRRFAGI